MFVSAQGVQMKDERIEAVKSWPEPKSVRDIQVFIGFANFYRHFIQGFSKIAAPLTSMLKTSSTASTLSQKLMMGYDETSNKKSSKSKNPAFLTADARQAFTRLRQAFTEAPILSHFDPERHIRIETDASGYAIGGVLSQLTSASGQWNPVAYFSRKMIPAETRYETHDGELLAIVEAFKTWRHYLEGCKHEVLVLTDHNNLRRFMDTKSLSSRQVRWAQELSRYHFRIDYRQGKANAAADALSRFPQRSLEEEEKLRAENTQILHCLQPSLTSASLAGLSLSGSSATPLHQVLICGTHILPQLRQFWNNLLAELANEGPYKASIGSMSLKLQELQDIDSEAHKIRAEGLKKGWKEADGVTHHQSLPFVPEVIRIELISQHHNDSLAGHFGFDKTRELIAWKYYWPSLQGDCDVCLASKAVRHKPYGDLQALLIPTYRWKDLSMDFVTGLLKGVVVGCARYGQSLNPTKTRRNKRAKSQISQLAIRIVGKKTCHSSKMML